MPKARGVVPGSGGEPFTRVGERQVRHLAFVPLEGRKLPAGLNIPQTNAGYPCQRDTTAIRMPRGIANAGRRTDRRVERAHELAVRRAIDERLASDHVQKHFSCRAESSPTNLGGAGNG